MGRRRLREAGARRVGRVEDAQVGGEAAGPRRGARLLRRAVQRRAHQVRRALHLVGPSANQSWQHLFGNFVLNCVSFVSNSCCGKVRFQERVCLLPAGERATVTGWDTMWRIMSGTQN